MNTPRVVIKFPKQYRKAADCQGEVHVFKPKLIDQLKSIHDGLEAGMTFADVQQEYDARQAENLIENWARKLAENPRRSPSETASFLCALAGRLNGEEAS